MMNRSVIFTNPPAKTREGHQRRGMFPLPLIVLGNSLSQEVEVNHISPDLLADYSLATTILSQSNADWLAVTCYQEGMWSVVELAKVAKSLGKKVILGGHHVSLWGGEKILREIPEADYVIMGEGEFPLKLLVEGINPEQIPGLWWRKNGIPKTNRLPLYFNDWANQPPMIKGYSTFDYSALWERIGQIGRTGYSKPFSVIGIRGCAYAQRSKKRCSFCAMPLANRLRCRTPRYFWEEILWAVRRYQIDLIWEHSESFLGSPKWLANLANTQPKNAPPIWCYGRADEINTNTVGLLSKIGVEHILIGIEVGSDERLKEINKGITLNQILNAIRLCGKHNIRVQASFIIGLPGETQESLNETMNFALLCRDEGADDIMFHEFILRKGLQWFEVFARKHPELNQTVLDQGVAQNLMWQYLNPKLERKEAMEKVAEAIREFPHSELTAWNI